MSSIVAQNLSLAICIPTYNRAETLRATLADLAQHQDLFEEVVICDNASPDHTQAVVEEMRGLFPKLTYIRHDMNIGSFRNYNAALSQTRCRYQYMLCDDDRLFPDGIRSAVQHLDAHPDAVAAYGAYTWLDDQGVTTTVPPVKEPACYQPADRIKLVQEHYLLWLPIVRSEVFQRHCFYRGDTFGDWRLIDQLLCIGAIWVLPTSFYLHNPTPGRLETTATQAWYQEFQRIDWELYLSRLSIPPEGAAGIAQFISGRLDTALGNAQNWAGTLGLYQVERNFFLRRRAYGQRSVEAEQAWEERGLIAGALERAIEQLLVTGVTRVLVESGPMNLAALMDRVAAALPSVTVEVLDHAALLRQPAGPGDAILAEDWSLFDAREASGGKDDDVYRLAWADLVDALRLTEDAGLRILKGPDGTEHLL
jgi:hypothetical protein